MKISKFCENVIAYAEGKCVLVGCLIICQGVGFEPDWSNWPLPTICFVQAMVDFYWID